MPFSAWAMLCAVSAILVGGLATFTIIALKKKK